MAAYKKNQSQNKVIVCLIFLVVAAIPFLLSFILPNKNLSLNTHAAENGTGKCSDFYTKYANDSTFKAPDGYVWKPYCGQEYQCSSPNTPEGEDDCRKKFANTTKKVTCFQFADYNQCLLLDNVNPYQPSSGSDKATYQGVCTEYPNLPAPTGMVWRADCNSTQYFNKDLQKEGKTRSCFNFDATDEKSYNSNCDESNLPSVQASSSKTNWCYGFFGQGSQGLLYGDSKFPYPDPFRCLELIPGTPQPNRPTPPINSQPGQKFIGTQGIGQIGSFVTPEVRPTPTPATGSVNGGGVNDNNQARTQRQKLANICPDIAKGSTPVQGAPTVTGDKIDQVLRSYRSPASGLGQQIYDLGVKYNINPAFMLAFFIQESSCGTAGVAVTTRNAGNIICTHGHSCYQGFNVYNSWIEGMDAWYQLLRDEYIGEGLVYVETIIPKYAPPTENNSCAYVQNVINRVKNGF